MHDFCYANFNTFISDLRKKLKKVLTPAEKQRRYREKLKRNAEKYEEAKRKHRVHYHKTKRLVNDMTRKEKRAANLIWKRRQQNYRKNKIKLEATTPPSSPT